jgi:hypothetical protein
LRLTFDGVAAPHVTHLIKQERCLLIQGQSALQLFAGIRAQEDVGGCGSSKVQDEIDLHICGLEYFILSQIQGLKHLSLISCSVPARTTDIKKLV